MKLHYITALVALSLLGACAGRAPDPVQVVQKDDRELACFQIEEELDANNRRMVDLSGEESAKVAQNVAAGVAGLFIWPLWFAMDFQDAAGTEGEALASRNRYLAKLYARRCDGVDTTASLERGVGANAASMSTPRGGLPDIGGPVPYEGTRLDAFSAAEIQAYCAVDWTTRAGPEGRTLYNPCRKPTAFR